MYGKVAFIYNEYWNEPIQEIIKIFKDGDSRPLTKEEIDELCNFIKLQMILSELKNQKPPTRN